MASSEGGDAEPPPPRESKWMPRKYERVPGLEEVDPSDFVAVAKAREQWVRDR